MIATECWCGQRRSQRSTAPRGRAEFIGIGLWVVPRTWTLLKSSVNILLEGVPGDIDIDKVKEALRRIPGVQSFHDLHVWAVTSGKSTLTVHLVVSPHADADSTILPALRQVMEMDFGITHTTVQCELAPCHQTDERHHFNSSPAAELAAEHEGAHKEHGGASEAAHGHEDAQPKH